MKWKSTFFTFYFHSLYCSFTLHNFLILTLTFPHMYPRVSVYEFVCAHVHLSLQASVCVLSISCVCLVISIPFLWALCLCVYCASARRTLGSVWWWDLFGCRCIFLLQQWRHSVIQRARGGRPSLCAESENYYPSFKDHLHCSSTGTALCSLFFEECRFIASKISCNGWLRRGGGGDYTDNYKTWETVQAKGNRWYATAATFTVIVCGRTMTFNGKTLKCCNQSAAAKPLQGFQLLHNHSWSFDNRFRIKESVRPRYNFS